MALVSQERPPDRGPHRPSDGEQPRHQYEKLYQPQTQTKFGAMNFAQIRDRAARVRRLPLPEVLLLVGAQRDRYDQAKWHTSKGSLSIYGMKFMNWKEQFGGGGAIDLTMHLCDFDFLAAVAWLDRHFLPAENRQPAPPPGRSNLILPPQEPRCLPGIIRYLVQERSLDVALIQSLLESSRLYADPRGNAVFLLLGKENRPVGAELRGATPARWRGMAPVPEKTSATSRSPLPPPPRLSYASPPSMPSVVVCFFPVAFAYPHPEPGRIHPGFLFFFSKVLPFIAASTPILPAII